MQDAGFVTFRGWLLASTAVLLLNPGMQAAAQIEEVVVTATKSGETLLQKTPVSITAFTANAVDRSLLLNVKDLVQYTPNLTLNQNGAFAQIYIRGIGSNNVFAGSDPSSTVHVDGVYFARPYQQFASFLDVERIEVLRGPQGTLYGRNSVGGTINVISRKPGDEYQAKAQLTGGNYGLFQGEAYVSGPIMPGKLEFSVSGSYARHDAYRKNIIPSGNDVDDLNTGAGRAQLRFQPTDWIDATTRVDFQSQSDALPSLTKIMEPYDPATNSILGDFGKVALNTPVKVTDRGFGFAEDIDIQLGNGMKLKSLTAYRANTSKTRIDTDATDRSFTVTNTYEKQRQLSEELNLSGKLGALDYIAGLYYMNEHIASRGRAETLSAGTETRLWPTVYTNAYAVYSQGTYHVTDQLALTFGYRYTDEEKKFNQYGGVWNVAANRFNAGYPVTYRNTGHYKAGTPKFGVDYSPADNVMVYASVTRGFKSGGFNFTSFNTTNGFAPETIWSYEAGVKTEWFDRRLRVNAAAFHYDYKNFQISTIIRPGVTDITNAASVTSDGAELEITARPIPNLDVMANFGILKSTWDRFPVAPAGGGLTFDASGLARKGTPAFTSAFVAEYRWPLAGGADIFVRGEFFYQSHTYFNLQNDSRVSAAGYGLLNGSVGYESADGTWRLALWGKNLADRVYFTSLGTASTPVLAARVGAPRTLGARLTWKM
jgi:iron complex outermembrane recepter protein